MREEGLKAIWVQPYTRTTIDPDFDQKLKNILNRSFNPKVPNTVWVTDLFSRKIIGWHLSDYLSTEGVLVTINKAKACIKATPASSFIRSYSKKGTPWANACIESFHVLIKREWLNRFVIKPPKHAHKLVFEDIATFYNTERIHNFCDMTSPYDYEAEYIRITQRLKKSTFNLSIFLTEDHHFYHDSSTSTDRAQVQSLIYYYKQKPPSIITTPSGLNSLNLFTYTIFRASL